LKLEFAKLEVQAKKDFQSESWTGRVEYRRSIDLRYRGQGYELNLPFTEKLLKDFEQEHQRRYGYAYVGREVELVTLRLRAIVKTITNHGEADALVRPSRAKVGPISPPEAQVQFDGKKYLTKIYSRPELKSDKKYSGPAIVTEYSATTVIPPGKRFRVDQAGNLIVTIR